MALATSAPLRRPPPRFPLNQSENIGDRKALKVSPCIKAAGTLEGTWPSLVPGIRRRQNQLYVKDRRLDAAVGLCAILATWSKSYHN